MSYQKKSSRHYEKANTRLASLKSIDTNMGLGNGLTVAIYEQAIDDLRNRIDQNNTHLSMIDEIKNQVKAGESVVKYLSERMLAGVASKFGKNSDKYEMAGGRKKSERRRPSKKVNK
jgi:phage shock protein A